MKKVKNILFRMNLKGEGIVNFDSSDQKWMFNGTNLGRMKTMYENTSYAKKKFYGTPEDLKYKICISSDCLKHEVFSQDVLFQSPNLINNEALLYSFIASPVSLIRGYVFAESGESLKRKGALTIVDAEQTCDAITSISTFSKSGLKVQDTEKTDNSFYKKEDVGRIEYSTRGNIDLMQLQFVSCSQMFDRYAFNPDLFDTYTQFMKTKLPSFNSKLGYYLINGSVVELPEYGFLLNDDDVQALVKMLFERLLKLNIKRKGAFAETSNLEYKLVYDVIEDRFDSENGWITIKDKSDIESISFDFEKFYIPENIEAAEIKLASIKADYERRKVAKKEKDADKKATAAAAKKAKKETKEKDDNNE